MVKIRIPYPEAMPEEVRGESLWATPLRNGTFRLENEPICEEYKFGDIVRVSNRGGLLEVESLVMRMLQQ
jgi:hypothetical protein